jgi:hypothetical protein
MKRYLMIALMLVGSACTDPEITCWYATSYAQQIGEPWLALHGRTARFREDVSGPMFKTQDELTRFINDRSLKMCGTK